MFKKIKYFIIGNDIEIDERLSKVYGSTCDIKQKSKIINSNKLLAITVLVVVVLALIFEMLNESNIEKKENEENTIFTDIKSESGTEYFEVEFEVKENINSIENTYSGIETVGIVNGDYQEDKNIKIEDKNEKDITLMISATIENSRKNSSNGEIVLPNTIDDNIEITWNLKEEDNRVLVIIALIFAVLLLWKNKYAAISKIEKDAKESVIKELPNFINKILLLLNGGMVFSESFVKIISDYEKNYPDSSSYFYKQLSIIKKSEKEVNKSLVVMFHEFSKKIEVREFIRIATIIKEESKAGGDIKDKLKNEGEMLWHLRKKDAEERSKRAEIKMTFPLVILLIVMMLITLSPTFMEL